jgi:tetratricopeptide (TPR) repeat protein
LGPEWADPRKGAGDIFLAQGKFADAISEYAAAADRAPGWGALYLDWGKALWHSGRRDEALARFRKAAATGLSRADLARAKLLYRRALTLAARPSARSGPTAE